jgi:hypothetical protein
VSSSATSTSNGGAGFRFNNGASLYDTPVVDPGFHIVTWQIDDAATYADAKMFVDGTLPENTFTGSSTNPTNTAGFTGTDLELILGTGRSTSGTLLSSDYFAGQLAEFLVFNDQLTVGQINLVANYLSTEYALPFAYETNLLFSQAALVGDFNLDGSVDAADYVVWRNTGIHGAQGYDEWRANLGKSTTGFGLGAASSELVGQVPEPRSWIILTTSLLLVQMGFRRDLRAIH